MHVFHGRMCLIYILVPGFLIAPTFPGYLRSVSAKELPQTHNTVQQRKLFQRKIDFISTVGKRRTPSPSGWEEYDGSIYTKETGYGWLTDMSGNGWDGGGGGKMIMPDGTRASPQDLARLELANWQGTHQENRPVVFRIDLPNGWYRITCTSVHAHNAPLPLVNQRGIKFRAHDVVFAGPTYGAPLKIEGNRLIEGSEIVEVTEEHLRIVVGDPAYGGWTWSYEGPWYRGWNNWVRRKKLHRYAESWYQKITRSVDPGFHSLRLNSLEIERVKGPVKKTALLFRDLFNRDDNADINTGVGETNRWTKVKLHPAISDQIESELYKTSLKLTGSKKRKGVIGVLQKKVSPEKGTVRYSTRVSLFTGEGSKIHSGSHEAGLLILGEQAAPTEFNSTFIGVAFDKSRAETPGWFKYRVGNGQNGYRTKSEIPDSSLPFKVTEGEYGISVDHDVKNNVLQRIQFNGTDITELFAPGDLKQRVPNGIFGVRAYMDPLGSGVDLRQFYWYYRVEQIS